MVFLPQSFGPFQTDMGKNVADMLNKFADIIFARDSISYAHLLNAGCDEKKILLFPDFTSTVNGISLEKHRNLKEGVCIIPNKRMIDKGGIDKIKYIEFITTIISEIEEKGKHPFLLNHESIEDSELCSEININLKNKLPIVDNVNSLEVKGIISNSYLTITSRFHGAASALNTGVPCLATSWSHKYEELFRDFKQYDCILDINNINEAINKVTTFLNPIKNIEIRNNILENQKVVGIKNKEMWEIIWRKYSSKK
jgi:colanic acid/amylovoran biosynthesis protein